MGKQNGEKTLSPLEETPCLDVQKKTVDRPFQQQLVCSDPNIQ